MKNRALDVGDLLELLEGETLVLNSGDEITLEVSDRVWGKLYDLLKAEVSEINGPSDMRRAV